jgi:hypothetical protein
MKKILFVLISLSLAFSVEVLAQKKTASKKAKSTKTQPTTKAGSTEPGGKEFVSTEGKFKVLFPAPPTIKVSEQGEGERRLKSVTNRVFGGMLSYGVTVTESFSSARVDNERELLSLRNLIVSGREVVKETKLTLNEINGIEIVYKGNTQSLSQHRIYLVGKRWYEVVVVYPYFTGENPETILADNKAAADKFFDSFQILK